jgi:hypothetical protein
MTNGQPIEYRDGFVLNPDPFYSPSFRISPFRTEDIADNLQLPRSVLAMDHLDCCFQGRRWRFTECGKEGIALALEALKLGPSDCVTIFTTTGNLYVSGCVTREIEKVCQWSREMRKNTAALFVIHEFGYPYRNLSDLRRFGLPIIEDACHSFLADTEAGDMGRVGDFIVFSLPKVFPLQMGGILSYEPSYEIKTRVQRGSGLEDYLASVLSQYIPTLDAARVQRLKNYHQLVDSFATLGCAPRLDMLSNDVPGVFMFTVPEQTDLSAMKEYGWCHGVECSVFYGERAFFIPVHQRLRQADLDYFYAVFSSFILRH